MTLKVNAASVPRAERIIRRAALLAGDAVGDAVYVSGPRSGVIYAVTKLLVTLGTEAPFAGVIIKKITATEGLVQFAGPVLGIYTGLTPGSRYFVSSAGVPTLTPTASTHPMGLATSDDEIVIEQNTTGGGGSGIDEDAHEVLDTLVHALAEDSYTEVTRDSVTQLITAIVTWTDAGKTLKIREEQITRVDRRITEIVKIQYNAAGVEKYRTADTVTRSGILRPRVASVTMDRTP